MSTIAETATLAHGFTMADVDKAARVAASKARAHLFQYEERHDLAWMAIVEEIYSSDERPESLTKIGFVAINRAADEERRQHGKSSYRPLERDEWAPRFAIYWRALATAGDFTEQIAERVALRQVLSELTPAEYEAVSTLAAFGDVGLAADALGVSRGTFNNRMMKARRRINVLWLAPETPPGPRKRGEDGKCSYGHDLSEHGYQDKGRDRIMCGRCIRNAQRRRRARA